MDQDAGNESIKNQFNFSERAAQTFTNPTRERGVITEPPPMVSFKDVVAQWEIYDFYMIEYAAQVPSCTAQYTYVDIEWVLRHARSFSISHFLSRLHF